MKLNYCGMINYLPNICQTKRLTKRNTYETAFVQNLQNKCTLQIYIKIIICVYFDLYLFLCF